MGTKIRIRQLYCIARFWHDCRSSVYKRKWKKYEGITHAYVHRLADVHLAGFAPAFTLSFHDSERSRKPPMPIASVVTCHSKKRKKTDSVTQKSLTNCPLLLDFLTCRLDWICWLSGVCSADNSSQILKERIGLLAFATTTINERNSGNGDFRFENKKTKFDFFRLRSLAGWKCLANKLDEKTKKEKQTHWQPEKRENPFRAVVKVLKRKKNRLRFCFQTDFQFI